MPFENYSEDDFQAFAEQMNRPRTGLNLEKIADNLRRAANAADKVSEVYWLMKEAKRNNPRGLIF